MNELPDDVPIVDSEDLIETLESLDKSDYVTAFFDSHREYSGQPWTDQGERGKRLVEGLTMRDIADCFIVGCFHASGLDREHYPNSVYELPWDDISPIAVSQNMVCEIERKMGIFPNIPQ